MKELVTVTFAVEHLLRGFERTVTQVTNTGVGRLLCVCLFSHDSTFDIFQISAVRRLSLCTSDSTLPSTRYVAVMVKMDPPKSSSAGSSYYVKFNEKNIHNVASIVTYIKSLGWLKRSSIEFNLNIFISCLEETRYHLRWPRHSTEDMRNSHCSSRCPNTSAKVCRWHQGFIDYKSIRNYSMSTRQMFFPSRLATQGSIGGANHKVNYDKVLQVVQRLNEMETVRTFQTIHVKYVLSSNSYILQLINTGKHAQLYTKFYSYLLQQSNY